MKTHNQFRLVVNDLTLHAGNRELIANNELTLKLIGFVFAGIRNIYALPLSGKYSG